ncbi:MAG: alkaline phosphatase family protein [Patescibacteria group bacterium]|nr:MAG: alkaline phosphatase family protein [Patescibacteria group bacterium]
MSKEPTTNYVPYLIAVIVAAGVLLNIAKKEKQKVSQSPNVPSALTSDSSVQPPSANGSPDAAVEPAPAAEADVAPDAVPAKLMPEDPMPRETFAASVDGKTRVVLVSLDGLHAKLVGKMPVMQQLFKEGSYTLKARVPTAATTAVSHAALFTGADPGVNGVTTEPKKNAEPTCRNDCAHVHGVAFRWAPLNIKETLFTAVEKSGRGTNAYVEKGKLVGLLRADGTESGIVTKNSIDAQALRGCAAFKDPKVGLIVLHFKAIDGTGHDIGWLEPEQYATAKLIDGKLGTIRDCIAEADARDGLATTLIVTADHGGTPGKKKGHSANNDNNRLVPWVAVGPGIKMDHEIEGRDDLHPIARPSDGNPSVAPAILLYDTVPTILRIFDMPASSLPDMSPNAKSVGEIFVQD